MTTFNTPGPRPGRKLFWWTLAAMAALALLLLGLTVAAAMLHLPAQRLAALVRGAWVFKMVGVTLQLLAVAIAAWRWPALVDWAARRGVIRPGERAGALAARGKAVLLMAALIVAMAGGDLLALMRAWLNS